MRLRLFRTQRLGNRRSEDRRFYLERRKRQAWEGRIQRHDYSVENVGTIWLILRDFPPPKE